MGPISHGTGIRLARRLQLGIGVVGLIALIALAGCGKSGTGGGTQATTPAAGGGPTITISGFAFGGDLTVAPGATVTVKNMDSVAHTLSDKNGAFDTGSIAGGGSGTFTAPMTPGTYSLVCKFHPQMSGTLTVQAGAGAGAGAGATTPASNGGGGGYGVKGGGY
jgi:plastocyanin